MRKQRLSEGLLSMVFTLLHYVHAYIIYKVLKKRLDLTGLIIGSFLPDLEIPVIILLGFHYPFDRLILHSFLGCLMLSWLIGFLAYPVYSKVVRRILNVKLGKISTFKYALSVEVSALIHVLIDSMHHEYNPLLWPITAENVDEFVLFGNWLKASIFMHTLFTLFMLTIIHEEIGLWKIAKNVFDISFLKTCIAKLLTLNSLE